MRIQRGNTATSAMNETSRMSLSRFVHGSRPSTLNSPAYEVSPRIALSAVVLPAPFGPISPRMRPSSTRKSMPSSAMVVPKALRRPRASIVAMASALLLFRFRSSVVASAVTGGRIAPLRGLHQFFRCDAEQLNGCGNARPLFGKKFLPFAFEQQIPRAGFDEHAEASPGLDQLLAYQLLIGLENGQRIDPKLGRDVAHGGQRIAFVEHAVENHGDDTVAKLAVNWLAIIPLMHPVFH